MMQTTSSFKKFAALLSALFLATSVSEASPIQPIEDIAFDPTILNPAAGTVWVAGSKQTVTWETSNIPTAAKGETGLLLWGYLANSSENLDIASPLASNFPITQGYVQITVPVDPGCTDNCIIVLFGDSGNSRQITVVSESELVL